MKHKHKQLNQRGFHIIEFLIVIIVIGAIGFVGMRVVNKQKEKEGGSGSSKASSAGGHKADANGLVDAQELECVPRGHDNYRTNSTLAVDPKDANTVYVGVEYKGVYKSTDGGATWKESDKGIRGYPKEGDKTQKCVQELGRTVIDPKDNKHLLITRVESPGDLSTLFSENAGVWETKDAGATWSQLIKPGMNASGSQAIAFDPQNSDVIYHGVNYMHPSFTGGDGKAVSNKYFNTDGILYHTSNGGKDWAELPTGVFPGYRAINVAVDPSDGKKLWLFTFVGSEDGKTPDDSQMKAVVVSTDGGKSWTSQADKLPAGYKQLVGGALSPVDGKNAYITTSTTSSAPKSFYTLDGGATWSASNKYTLVQDYDPTDATGHHLLGYAPYDSSPGIVESMDGGKTWALKSNLPSEVDNQGNFGVRVSGFAWSKASPNTVYMSGSGGYAWKSTDGGKTWKTVLTIDKIGGPNKNKAGNTKSREQDPSGH